MGNVPVKHAYARYRLALDVFDNTDKVVFVLFDKPAIQLVKFSASSLMRLEHDPSDERGTLPPPLANLIGATHVFEIKSHTYYDHGMFESFICCAIDPHELSVEGECSSPFDRRSVASKTSLKSSDHDQSISSVEGFACWTMNADESDIEGECSSAFINQTYQDPSIATPSKPAEIKKNIRDDLEDSDVELEKANANKVPTDAVCGTTKRRRKRK
ncbi:nucleic acid-binding, OB-fold protein [Artemisia annua]|uniref:Nucleic acid-binding, OB-fold protein n=1 Tax=Artemisia annua TaxID=35608 RepID=A0A2U1NV16_ARTAN|nr:nucleic acid-binding, OB-fold protein [Artemisia annua]